MLYSIAFFIFSLLYLPALIFKGRLHGDFHERFAYFKGPKKQALLSGSGRIWIQAVSVGEVSLCKSLIPELKKRYAGRNIVISTVTKTGNDLAKKLFSKDAFVIYFPLDFKIFARKAVSLIRPAVYIMIETEIWPNLLSVLSDKNVPCMMMNGRISDRSAGKYRIVKPFLKKVLSRVSLFCMQSDVDAGRIIELGAGEKKVIVTGNMKFDALPSQPAKEACGIKTSFGLPEACRLLVAGSTHEGEEEVIVDVFKKLRVHFPELRLLIAPRHVERSSVIEKLVRSAGFESVRFSSIRTTNDECLSAEAIAKAERTTNTSIIILDMIGHLNEAYSAADLVFMGGSLIKHGGQNPIEPSYFARPVLFGPYMFNFRHVSEALLKDKAALQVFAAEDLFEKCSLLLADRAVAAGIGARAKEMVERNRGATRKNVEELAKVLA